MSARARRPTDEVGTEVFDPEQRALFGAARPAAAPLRPLFDTFEDATEVTPFPRTAVEHATPTRHNRSLVAPSVAPPDPPAAGDLARLVDPGRPGRPGRPDEQAVPVERGRGIERSEPIRVISMKDHTEAQKPRAEDPRVHLQVQLRSMAEVAGRHDMPVGLGNLAPPRDPRQARARRVRDNVAWACVAIVLACAISLAIWFVAGR